MCDALVHRGPDSDGYHVDGAVALGARRLAIIDVRRGDQPLFNEDGSVAVVLNGEIYNFEELRRRLAGRGHVFATHSDTEVIAHLYEDLGDDLVHELRGMFAFALWDARRRRLLVARDRVGKKPLYYRDDGRGDLVFASELASLLEDDRIERRPVPEALDAYLTLLYVPEPLSAIEGVRRLPPAARLTWEDGHTRVDTYWELAYDPKHNIGREQFPAYVAEALDEAVRVRLISERPLGAFLSGGVDSTAVVEAMTRHSAHPVKTFSIGFESERYNELPYARRVAEIFGTDHTEHIVRMDAVDVLPKLITHYGEPFGDSSAIPSFYVAQAAAQHVTVVLNGDGGDEMLAGYNRYVAHGLAARLAALPRPARVTAAALAALAPHPSRADTNYARALRLARGSVLSAGERYAMQMSYLTPESKAKLYTDEFAEATKSSHPERRIADVWDASRAAAPLDRLLDVDVRTYLPGDLLVKMDIATMANSLEARSPFLDQVFMEKIARLPVSAKLAGRVKKAALKQTLRGAVPDELLDRPKWGFSIPLADWFRGSLGGIAREVVLDPRARERALFRPKVVERLFDEHAQRRADRGTELWLLFVLELWHRRFVDGLSESALF